MPKTKLGTKYSMQSPEIDWLWAAVLERKMVHRYDLRDMARIAGVTYETMRRLIGMSPWDWPRDVRDRVVNEFKIQTYRGVIGCPGGPEAKV